MWKQFGQIADIRQGKIGRRQCIDGRTGVQAKREHRQRQDRFPAGFARCRGFGLCGLVLRFRCRGHVRRPQMSEQKTEPSLDRPRDGSSTRHSSNWPGVWADEINSTLSPQRRLGAAAAGCVFWPGGAAQGSPSVSGGWLLWPRQWLPAEVTNALSTAPSSRARDRTPKVCQACGRPFARPSSGCAILHPCHQPSGSGFLSALRSVDLFRNSGAAT